MFPIIKPDTTELSAESLVSCCSSIFSEYGLSEKIESDAIKNFISEIFHKFVVSSIFILPYLHQIHHQNNGQVPSFIKFIKIAIKNI